jgi:NAD(P)-dependent dehydrogenase (short-subunit alcohol dehydrogenase family)
MTDAGITGAGTVLITGAAIRLGAVIARRLAEAGWKVIIHYNKSEAAAAALVAELNATGFHAASVQADLAHREDIEGLIGRCTAAHGRIDCLVNNASAFFYDDITTVTWDSFHTLVTPNLVAPLLLSRDFAAQFGEAEGGCIVNLLDQKIANLNPDFLSYTLSKVAMGGLTEALAMALAPHIRVNAVAPGLTLISGKQTAASFERAWQAAPMGRSCTPDEIARAVLFILSIPSMTGETIFVDGGESLRGRPRDVAFDTALALPPSPPA